MNSFSSVKYTRKTRRINNPYQNVPFAPRRIIIISILMGLPTALFFYAKNIYYLNDSNSILNALRSPSLISDENFSFRSSFDDNLDPKLKNMTFTLPGEDEPRIFEAYTKADISSFYQEPPGSRHEMIPYFRGMAAKFVNLSPTYLALYWNDGKRGMLVGDLPPFQAIGTASHPSHQFFICPKGKPNEKLLTIHMKHGQNLYVYNPYELDTLKVEDLNQKQRTLYDLQMNNLFFAKQYKKFTGRDWLSLYGQAKKPIHKMWPADFFGQTHWVQTRETHFVEEPPEKKLVHLTENEMDRNRIFNRDFRGLEKYRSKDKWLNMTLKVISCEPRVFEIEGFLSKTEVDHFVHMATGMKLDLSTVSGSDGLDRNVDTKSRTSHNTWVSRDRSPIIDAIYHRAADLMQIDEAMLRRKKQQHSSAEDLQLVHYEVGEQYTPHHDSTYPNTNRVDHPMRFATLILYLNEVQKGGETSFPRYRNADTRDKISVTPKVGKAVLFYNVLPDGNLDDMSQHAAEPVLQGEKWMTNLWTWNPQFIR